MPYSIEFGRIILDALEEQGLTYRQASERTAPYGEKPIAISSIHAMGKGRILPRSIIRQTVFGLGLDLRKVYAAAGLIPYDWELTPPPPPDTKQGMIERAYMKVKTDPDYKFGNRAEGEINYCIKLEIVRFYEKLTGNELLPKDLTWP